jgi:hypothetical protein
MTVEADVGDNLQIEVSCGGIWEKALPDGSVPRDSLQSVGIEVGYPDSSEPLLADGQPNLRFHSAGVHHSADHGDQDGPLELARWTAANARVVVRFGMSKPAEPIPGWDVGEVVLRKTLTYGPSDPRVDCSSNGSTLVVEERRKGRTIVIWEIYSDKYFEQTSFSYELHATARSAQAWRTSLSNGVHQLRSASNFQRGRRRSPYRSLSWRRRPQRPTLPELITASVRFTPKVSLAKVDPIVGG